MENKEIKKQIFLTFLLESKKYAIPTENIIEILKLPELFTLEHLPKNVVGLLNFRGKVISIIDMRIMLKLEKRPYTADQHVIIAETNGKKFGTIVDSLADLIEINPDDIDNMPYKTADESLSGIYNKDNEMFAILNLDNFTNYTHNTEEENDEKEENVSPVQNPLMPVDKHSIEKMKSRALSLKNSTGYEINKNIYIKDKFVLFALSNETYCISLNHVKEFQKLKTGNILNVPSTPNYIRGIINFRGEFICVIDLKYFLNIPQTKGTEKTRIIFIQTELFKLALIVDELFEIIDIPVENLKNTDNNNENNTYMAGEIILNDGKIANILNIEKILSEENLNFEDYV